MFRLLSFILLLPFSVSLVQGEEQTDFVAFPQARTALINANLIDGTGSKAKPNTTIILNNGIIEKVGPSTSTPVPNNSTIVDLKGKSVLPGLVMMHEHLYYDVLGKPRYQPFTYPRLYLASGVTTARTSGAMNGYVELNLRDEIKNNLKIGPDFDITSPFFNSNKKPLLEMNVLDGPENVKKMLDYWSYEGVTSVKVHSGISKQDLTAVIKESHAKNLKVTGHLGRVTFKEAAQMGIDNIEHGLLFCPDFVKNKVEDVDPGWPAILESIEQLDMNSPEVSSLIDTLVKNNVALTSTLVITEYHLSSHTYSTERIFDLLHPVTHEDLHHHMDKIKTTDPEKTWISRGNYKKAALFEKMFFDAGGLLTAGTDPIFGDVIAGFANHRQIELLVEAGLSPLNAIKVSSLHGAKYLGREAEIGSIEEGKKADLFIVSGDPSKHIHDIRNVEYVFKAGIGYDSAKLIQSCEGLVGKK